MKKYGKIWKNIEKHGALPVPVCQNQGTMGHSIHQQNREGREGFRQYIKLVCQEINGSHITR